MRTKQIPNDAEVAECIHSLTDEAVTDMTSAAYLFAARVGASLLYSSDLSPAELTGYAVGMFRYGILWAMWSGLATCDESAIVDGEEKDKLRQRRIDTMTRLLGGNVASTQQQTTVHNPASYL